MSKVFTYSRLPEHQVAIYHDDSCNPERQTEWNVVECLFSFFAYLLLLITFPISIFFSIKVIKDYERAVVFRLGRLLPSKGQGVIFINPYIDKWSRVDIRARAFSVPPQQVRTSDGGYASAGAEVHFCIKDPVLSKTAVLDLNHSLRMLAQTTLSHSLSSKKLVEVQNDRKFINKQVQEMVNKEAASWGVEIKRIEMSEVNVLKEADGPVGALSALFGGGLQSAKLGNMSFADPALTRMLSAMSIQSKPSLPESSANSVKSGRGDTGVNLLTPEELVKLVSGVLNESLVKEIGGMFQFNVIGETGGTWYLDLRSGHGRIYTNRPIDKPDVVLTMNVDDMQKIFYGQCAAFDAYMQGGLKVDGDLKMAMSLEAIVKMLREKPVSPEKPVLQKPGVHVV